MFDHQQREGLIHAGHHVLCVEIEGAPRIGQGNVPARLAQRLGRGVDAHPTTPFQLLAAIESTKVALEVHHRRGGRCESSAAEDHVQDVEELGHLGDSFKKHLVDGVRRKAAARMPSAVDGFQNQLFDLVVAQLVNSQKDVEERRDGTRLAAQLLGRIGQRLPEDVVVMTRYLLTPAGHVGDDGSDQGDPRKVDRL